MEYRYTAIVLQKRETGETDRLYTLYTKEHGKIITMAKGVRKSTAKLAAQLENGSEVGVTVIKGRGIGKIAGAIAEEPFPSLRADYQIYETLLTTLERVKILTEPEEADVSLYELLLQFLHLGEKLVKEGKHESFFFLRECLLLKLYAQLGYEIDTKHCVATGEKLTRGQKYMFSPRDGACVLSREAHKYPQAVPVSEDAVVLLRLIMTNSLASLLKLTGAEKETKNIGRVAEALYRWTIRH